MKKVKPKKDYESEGPLFLEKEGRLLYKKHKNGKDQYFDVSDFAPSYMHENLCLGEGVKVFDLLKLLKKNQAFYTLLLSRFWFSEYMELFFSGKKAKKENIENISAVELYWSLSYSEGEELMDRRDRELVEKEIETGKKVKEKTSGVLGSLNLRDYVKEKRAKIKKALLKGNYFSSLKEKSYLAGSEFPQCHLYKINEKNVAASQYEPALIKGEKYFYSMSFSDPLFLRDLELSLGSASIFSEDLDPNDKDKIKELKKASYTLSDVITGFFWELSWYGSPKNTKSKGEEVFSIAKKVLNKKIVAKKK